MDLARLDKQLGFLTEVDKVKSVFRNTLLLDKTRRENDAEHMWHMAVCALLFQEYLDDPKIDMLKVLKLVLVHDVVDIYAGDTYAYDMAGHETQALRERQAADRLFALLPADQEREFRSLWDEFEEHTTNEAKYAHLLDAFMPLLHNYLTNGAKWQELGATRDKVLQRCRDKVKPCSSEIWNYLNNMIEDAVKKGYLPVE